MKRTLALLLAALFSLLFINNIQSQNDKLTPDLKLEIGKSNRSEQLKINIRLAQQYDVKAFDHVRQIMDPQQLRSYVVNELKSFSERSQQPLMQELNELQQAGEISQIKSLWIANVINCYASPAAILQLAGHTDIERIDIDEERILIDPLEIKEAGVEGTREITYNVNIMNVPQVWNMGYTGEGIVVAVLDTGVNYNHEDLSGNMWTHPNFPFHGWNFVNNNNNPMDYHGHGTHCAGTVAGNGNAGSQTGMAPASKIMALQVLGADGGGTESGVWAAIQFAAEYEAHVMSLSLGWRHIWNPDRASWRNAMNNALAAGVIAAVASGNEGGGSAPHNVRTPGDIPAPWRNPDQPDTGSRSAVVTIGATDVSDNLAGFSSRGPVTWQDVSPYHDYPYNPGTGLITPDVCAPGVNVKSLSHSNTSGYAVMSGTSMAAPGAAGVMALVLSKNPWLKPEQLSQILEETALALTPVKSNTYGAGRIDALAAVMQTNFPGPVYDSHSINDDEGNSNGQVNPSETIKLNLALINESEFEAENIETIVTTDSPYVSLMNSTISFGTFQPGETIEIADAVSFNTSDQIPGGYKIVFRLESTDGNLVWTNSFTIMAYAPNLAVGSLIIDDSTGNGNGQPDPGEAIEMGFDIISNGQMDALYPEISISTSSPFLTIHPQQFSLETMPPSSSQTISFDAEVAEYAPVGAVIDLICNVQYGNYLLSRTFSMRVGLEVEGFETGDFSAYDWKFAGHQPWHVTSVNPFQGSFTAKSGEIDHNQMSVIIMNAEVSADDSISFYRRVSSEPINDFLRFYINWQLMGEWSGEVSWDKVTFPVSKGSADFLWMYKKNSTISSGEDAAWIDVVSFPLSPVTSAWAGSNAGICENSAHQLNAYATHFNSLEWSSNGNGTFSDPFILNPVYIPGSSDIASGVVTLTLTVNGEEESISDDLLLTVEKLPAMALKPSGPDSVDLHKVQQTVYQIDDVVNAEAYEWLLEPEQAGELSADRNPGNH
jgi:subtilisin family serine protease